MDIINQQPIGEQKLSTVWYIVGVIIIVAVLIALYYLIGTRELTSITPPAPPEGAPTEVAVDKDVAEVIPSAASEMQAIETQGASDAVSSIESDLTASGLEGLDKELSDIEQELNKP